MNEKADRIQAKRDAAIEQGGRDMWREIVADTVLMLLNRDEPVTRDGLRGHIETQITQEDNKFARAKMIGALNVLNGRQPRD